MLKKLGIWAGFKSYVFDKTRATHVLFLIIVISGAIALYFIKGNSTQNSLAEQMLHREQIISRSGAISISGFLTDLGRGLSVFSTRQEIGENDTVLINQNMNKFIDAWHDTPLAAFILIDKKGIVTIDLNNSLTQQVGTDLSDRAYFRWSQTAQSGSYYIGNPVVSRLGVTKGQYIIPIAVPVFNNEGNYDGTIVAIVSLKSLAEKYVNPLKISGNTDIYMLDSKANLVFSTVPEYLGKNLTDVVDVVNFPGKDKVSDLFMREFAKPSTEGKLDVILPDIDEGGKIVRSLLAYSTVETGSNANVWYLIVSTPATDAFVFTKVFYTDQLISLIYFIVVILTFSIIGTTSRRYKK